MNYLVVENAGYEGERDVGSFNSWPAAFNFVKRVYTADEQDEMHVAICTEQNGERSYECY